MVEIQQRCPITFPWGPNSVPLTCQGADHATTHIVRMGVVGTMQPFAYLLIPTSMTLLFAYFCAFTGLPVITNYLITTRCDCRKFEIQWPWGGQ